MPFKRKSNPFQRRSVVQSSSDDEEGEPLSPVLERKDSNPFQRGSAKKKSTRRRPAKTPTRALHSRSLLKDSDEGEEEEFSSSSPDVPKSRNMYRYASSEEYHQQGMANAALALAHQLKDENLTRREHELEHRQEKRALVEKLRKENELQLLRSGNVSKQLSRADAGLRVASLVLLVAVWERLGALSVDATVGYLGLGAVLYLLYFGRGYSTLAVVYAAAILAYFGLWTWLLCIFAMFVILSKLDLAFV